MKKLLASLLLIGMLACSSCTALSVSMTPDPVKQSISRATAVAQYAAENPPSDKDLIEFLKANADAWTALCEYYGLTPPKEIEK